MFGCFRRRLNNDKPVPTWKMKLAKSDHGTVARSCPTDEHIRRDREVTITAVGVRYPRRPDSEPSTGRPVRPVTSEPRAAEAPTIADEKCSRRLTRDRRQQPAGGRTSSAVVASLPIAVDAPMAASGIARK